MKWLVDQAYPDATVVRLVLDNLTQVGLALRICAVRGAPISEFHHTPVHGKLAEHAEIELSIQAESEPPDRR